MYTILVIDDSVDLLESLVDLLELAGNRVVGAVSGKQGIEIVAQYQFDLIICDYKMPDMTGLQVLYHVRETRHETIIPFLLMTATEDLLRDELTTAVIPDGYLVKPFTFRVMLDAINAILSY